MNKLKFIIGIFSLIWISACTDFVEPAIPYSDFTTGVYLRTVQTKSNTLNFFDLDNAKWNVILEVVGENEGKDLAKDVEVYVRRRRGAALTPYVKLRTIPGSEFGAYPGTRVFPAAPNRNFPAKEVIVTANEALTAMGFTKADIFGGDAIEIRLVLNTNDGRTFSDNNLSSDISAGAFYASPFFYRVSVVCPSDLAGKYKAKTTGWCGTVFEGDVEFKKDGATANYIILTTIKGASVEDFTMGGYEACYGQDVANGSRGLRLTDSCNKIAFNASQSQFGDSFSVTSIAVEGTKLTIGWTTNWDTGGGVFESGTSEITRTDGKNWPALTK
jgi:hypothetical protein